MGTEHQNLLGALKNTQWLQWHSCMPGNVLSMLRILTHLVLQELCAVGPVILLILQLREGGGGTERLRDLPSQMAEPGGRIQSLVFRTTACYTASLHVHLLTQNLPRSGHANFNSGERSSCTATWTTSNVKFCDSAWRWKKCHQLFN